MKNNTLVLILIVICLLLSIANASTNFNTGGTYNISSQLPVGHVYIDFEAPGKNTTVNLLSGGSATGELFVLEDGTLNMMGGSIGDRLKVDDRGEVNIYSGSVNWVLDADADAIVNISGGTIGGRLFAHANSQVYISGGRIGDEIINDLVAYNSATIIIEGSNFAVDGVSVGHGEITSILGGNWDFEPTRHLTGLLSSGQAIDNDFYIGHSGAIVLIPEPTTLTLLIIGSLPLIRKRRK